MRTLFAAIALVLATGLRGAQAQVDAVQAQTDAVPSPLLLTTLPPVANARMVTALDLGYNERAFEPIAGERLEPQASVLLPLSSSVAVQAQLGVANTLDSRTRMAQQGESVEAVGSDLEGYWESDEAEGGATLYVGPTLAFSPAASWRFVVGGGLVLRAASSTAAPSAEQRSGYVLRTSVRLGW